MNFGLIYEINGQPVFCNRRSKKAFLQAISDLIDDCETEGATIFDLVLNTDVKKTEEDN